MASSRKFGKGGSGKGPVKFARQGIGDSLRKRTTGLRENCSRSQTLHEKVASIHTPIHKAEHSLGGTNLPISGGDLRRIALNQRYAEQSGAPASRLTKVVQCAFAMLAPLG